MSKNIILDSVRIPVTEYASQGNAILGIKGSGKSYSATGIAEQLLDAGIPIIAFDPIGVWRNLKVPGNGKGYKVVVAHPDNGDLTLTPESAPHIVRAAMTQNIPLVIDLYSMKLSKADWKRIVEQCIRLLLYENGPHGLRHIFIEEAAEFCPQRVGPDQGKVYAEMEKLARMGGNASLGFTIINQRSEEVNKAVLELCDGLFLHRQKGRNSLTALGKWLDFANPDQSKEIIKSIPTLPAGKCWAWLRESNAPQLIQMPIKNSFHPDRQHPVPASSKVVRADVTGFVASLETTLAEHIKKAKDEDPAELRRIIRELEAKLVTASRPVPPPPAQVSKVEVPVISKDLENALRLYLTEAEEKCRELAGSIDTLTSRFEQTIQTVRGMKPQPQVREFVQTPRPAPIRRQVASPGSNGAQGDGNLSKCERAILNALAQYPQGRTAIQVAILTEYSSSSGGFNNALSRLRTMEYISRGQPIQATEAGLDALGHWEPLPTGRELAGHWMNKLAKCEASILGTLMEAFPHGLSAQEVAERTNYQASSGGFNNSLSRLRTLELITRGQPMKASEDFFQ